MMLLGCGNILMCPDSSEEIFVVFIFAERMCDSLTTPLLVESHTPHANRKNDTERQNDEASLGKNGLVFLYEGLRNYESY